jgi:hypothetical protein
LRIQHLLQHLENNPRGVRNLRPQWISNLIEQVSDLFDPFTEVARVGFDCRVTDGRWEVALYLGRTELIGGRHDGSAELVNFRFDLLGLCRYFHSIERLEWNAVPQASEHLGDDQGSLVLLEGHWEENPVILQIHAVPPDQAGPGLKRFPDGRCEPV